MGRNLHLFIIRMNLLLAVSFIPLVVCQSSLIPGGLGLHFHFDGMPAAAMESQSIRTEYGRQRYIGESCELKQVKNMQFCTILNDLNLSSIGADLTDAIDISVQETFLQAITAGLIFDSKASTIQDTEKCRAAFMTFFCLDSVSDLYCDGSLRSIHPVCNSQCKNFLSQCSNFSSLQISSSCKRLFPGSFCTSQQTQMSTSVITTTKVGDSCIPQQRHDLTHCSILNGAKLTKDGSTVIASWEKYIPEMVIHDIKQATLVNSSACAAAVSTLQCLVSAAQFHCLGGTQNILPPCLACCTAIAASCYPGATSLIAEYACSEALKVLMPPGAQSSSCASASSSGSLLISGPLSVYSASSSAMSALPTSSVGGVVLVAIMTVALQIMADP